MRLTLVPFSYLVDMGTSSVLHKAMHSAQPTQCPTQWQTPGGEKGRR